MGLGKTLQILAFLYQKRNRESERRASHINSCSSLTVYNWKKEVERFTPQLSVCVMAGTAHERKELIKNQTSNVDVWITSYDLLKRDIELYQDIIFANEIIDEAQYIKNQTTHAAKSVRLVNSRFSHGTYRYTMENRLRMSFGVSLTI